MCDTSTYQQYLDEQSQTMPQGWTKLKRRFTETSTITFTTNTDQEIETALNLLKEMAEALEEGLAASYKMENALKRFHAWK